MTTFLVLTTVLCLTAIVGSFGFVSFDALQPEELAILQYDSRSLSDYWMVSALWNFRYAKQHGHEYIYYESDSCYHLKNMNEQLATAWCKVKSMTAALNDFPNVKFFIYMD